MSHPQNMPDGHQVTLAGLVTQGRTSPNWVPIKEDVGFAPRKIKITAPEPASNADIGGTWFENRYPGVAWYGLIHHTLLNNALFITVIDAYTFLFEPNPDESQFYASGPEIQLDDSYDWENKRIAVIGNGSSGVQCVAAMHSWASKLANYVRNPTWVASNSSSELARDGKIFAYTEEGKRTFKEDLAALFGMRKELENSVNTVAYAILRDHPFQQMAITFATQQMQERPENSHGPYITLKMKPTFHPGCRRLTPCDGYLESFQSPNTHMC
ncbi:hypothetical protein BBP40_006722 [Aspergillus hancockii]|nr:hypothetical protein BBP40_006722 [Aspergillus hancockii]